MYVIATITLTVDCFLLLQDSIDSDLVTSHGFTVCKTAKTGQGEAVLISILAFSLLFHTITGVFL